MAINVIEEVLAQKGLLVSPQEATVLLTKWTASGFASAANNLQVCSDVGWKKYVA